jgi:hypothetical protein
LGLWFVPHSRFEEVPLRGKFGTTAYEKKGFKGLPSALSFLLKMGGTNWYTKYTQPFVKELGRVSFIQGIVWKRRCYSRESRGVGNI